jgi:hypothetical protein
LFRLDPFVDIGLRPTRLSHKARTAEGTTGASPHWLHWGAWSDFMATFFGYVCGVVIICSALVVGFMKVVELASARNVAVSHGAALNPDVTPAGNKRPNSNLAPLYPTAFTRRPTDRLAPGLQ